MRARHLRGTALALALAISAAPTVRAEEPATEVDPAQVAAVVLQMVNTLDETDVDACREAITRLTEIEPERRIGILHAYVTVAGDSVHPFRREVLDIVLDRLGPSAVRDVLEEATSPESSLLERTLALRLVREREIPDSMSIVLAAGVNEEPDNLARPFVQRSIRESVAVVLAREPSSAELVERRFGELPGRVQDAILDVLEHRVEGFGTLEMSRLLGSDVRLNGSVLRRLVRLPIVRPRPLAGDALTNVAWSMREGDPATRACAVQVAGRFHMTSLLDELIALMDDPEPRVASAAHRALADISGARLIGRTELWKAWLDGEREWGESRLPGVLASLPSADEETVLSALQQLARHRMYREEIVPRLESACRHTSPTVRRLACETLGLLGSPAAFALLAVRLEDSEEGVVVAASAALERITGVATPEDPAAWRTVLRFDP